MDNELVYSLAQKIGVIDLIKEFESKRKLYISMGKKATLPQTQLKISCDVAARLGDFDVVDYLLDNSGVGIIGTYLCSHLTFDYTCGHGDIEKVIQLWNKLKAMEVRCVYGLNFAARGGHYSVVSFLLDNKCGSTSDAMDFAASGGYLHVVQLLHAYGCQATTWAMDCAAVNGHYDMLVWLHLNRNEGCTAYGIEKTVHVFLFNYRPVYEKVLKFMFRHYMGLVPISVHLLAKDTRNGKLTKLINK